MSKTIFINLPVKDVAAARAFYTKLGFDINEQFSNDQNAVVVVNEHAMLMLVEESFFMQNTKRQVADTKTVSEVGVAIQVDDRQTVDRIIDAALAAGGKKTGEVLDDETMYSRGVSDPDGHQLEVLCMKM